MPINILLTFITEIEKSMIKFIWKHKRPWIAKVILSKKSNVGGTTISGFNIYYRAIGKKKKTAWRWHQRPAEHNRRPIYEITWLHPPDFSQSYQKHTTEKRQPI
jgi:hypothetical protein